MRIRKTYVVIRRETNVYWTLVALVKRLDYRKIHHTYIKHNAQYNIQWY